MEYHRLDYFVAGFQLDGVFLPHSVVPLCLYFPACANNVFTCLCFAFCLCRSCLAFVPSSPCFCRFTLGLFSRFGSFAPFPSCLTSVYPYLARLLRCSCFVVCGLHQTRILSGRESAYCSLCDPQSMDPKVDNLTVLDDLNENSLLNILRTRFRKDMIYSNIGTILVSVNPFKPLPLYTPQQVTCGSWWWGLL